MVKLLAWLTGAALGDTIAGDLEEERRRRAVRSDHAARLWFWRAMLAVMAFFALRLAMTFASRVVQNVFRLFGGSPGRDVRQTLRAVRRTPWYSMTVVGVVAITMALASTVFAVVDGVLFKPLPYKDADRLFVVQPGFQDPSVRGTPSVSARELAAWQAAMPEVQFTGFDTSASALIEGPNEAGLGLAMVQPGFFEVVGVHPFMGGFSQTDFVETSGPPPIVLSIVISFELWQRRFGSDRSVIGREIDADPRLGRFRVAGVMPAGFVLPSRAKAHVLVPVFGPLNSPTQRSLSVLVRLPKDVGADAFRDRLEGLMGQLAEGQPLAPEGNRFRGPFDQATVLPLAERMTERTAPLFRALFAAIAAFVLIACLNVTGLAVARTLDRRRDFALRRAIGARSIDIARDLILEHAVLFGAGTALGVALAFPVLSITLSLLPAELHLLKTPDVDGRVLGFAVLAMGTSMLLSSLWPIRRALDASVWSLGLAGNAATERKRTVGRFAVVCGQIAGAMVLVVAGGLLVGSLMRVWSNDPGFEIDGLSIVELAVVPEGRIVGGPQRGVAQRLNRFLDGIREMPGLVSAGAVEANVLERSSIEAIGFWSNSPARAHAVGVPVTPGFFRAANLRLLEGRFPTDQELASGAPVVAISRQLAAAGWPGTSAIGHELVGSTNLGKSQLPPHVVVGVVENVRFGGWDLTSDTDVFAPYAALTFSAAPVVFIRTAGRPDRVLGEVLRLADHEGPTLRVVRAAPAADMLADTIRPRRLQSWLFGSFAAMSLVVVGIGLLGLVAMTMARRTHEVGIRMALGATRLRLVRQLLGEQLLPVVAGLAVGGLLAAWAVRFLGSYLYELTVYDVRVWTAATLVVAAAALAGTLLPSLRASRVDPVQALRVD